MNKKAILDFILIKYEKDENVDKEILKDIKATVTEIEVAQAMFNSVSDPKLVEAAIYREQAAKQRFDYLIKIAKQNYLSKNVEA